MQVFTIVQNNHYIKTNIVSLTRSNICLALFQKCYERLKENKFITNKLSQVQESVHKLINHSNSIYLQVIEIVKPNL